MGYIVNKKAKWETKKGKLTGEKGLQKTKKAQRGTKNTEAKGEKAHPPIGMDERK